jgi:hypothetical protein
MSYTILGIIGFVALLGIGAYFFFFRQGISSASSLPNENALVASEKANTYDTSRSSQPEQEPFNYRATSSNYSYYSGA